MRFLERHVLMITECDRSSTSYELTTITNLTTDHRSGPTKHLSEELTISSRPDLSSAPRVVSGGRALKSAEQFNGIMEPLADSLSAG
jgi:electron transfer flavoprotein alpha subunit